MTAAALALDAAALSPAKVTALQRSIGNRATSAALGGAAGRVLSRLGYPLGEPLPQDAIQPKFGEDAGEQRRYSRREFETMWEAEQGHKLTWEDDQNIRRGCIGVTANNLGASNVPPLNEAYSTFAAAISAADAYNAGLPRHAPNRYAVFGVHFWSNQDPVKENRKVPDPTAFLPDASGRVDMSGYKAKGRPDFIKFDFGFWDEATNCHWHANHHEAEPGEKIGPMKVYQSTRQTFSNIIEEDGEVRYGYVDFDREVFCVAKATHYDMTRAFKPKLTSPYFMRADGKPHPAIQAVFAGRQTLQAGSPKDAVAMVQQALVDLNYDLGEFGPNDNGVDGDYGKVTAAAVKRFKANENLGAENSGATERGVIYELDDQLGPIL
jgi:hypothetical protein